MTLLERTAERYRLKVRTDDCGERIIAGRFGQIYEHGEGKLGVMYMPDPKAERPPSPARWTNRKQRMLAAGFTIHQDCDGEGTALFDPGNPKQAKLAISVTGVKPRRVLSEQQRAVLEKARAASPYGSSGAVRREASAALESSGGAGVVSKGRGDPSEGLFWVLNEAERTPIEII